MPEDGTRLIDRVRRQGALLVVMALALAGHVGVMVAAPAPTFFEDEPHYNLYAHLDARAGNTSLLPGRLRFDQRPELISRLWAQFLTEDDLRQASTAEEAKRSPAIWKRARFLNLLLFLALIPLVHAQARSLGLGRTGALTAAALVGGFPWLGFYVHTLWAEVLHAFLLAVAFLAVLRHLENGRLPGLAAGGFATGWALLAKGALNPFLPVMVGFLLVVDLLRLRRDRSRPLWRALAAPAVFGLSAFLVVGPQLVANQADGHGFRIAGNRWKNLEMGLRLEPRERQDAYERLQRAKLHEVYMQAGADYEEREARAKQRALAYLEKKPLTFVLRQQGRKLVGLLFATPSFFERALTERWGDPAPGWLLALKAPARSAWTSVLILGLAGIALALRRGPGWIFLALFVGFFAAAALAIPYKVRFLAPLIPTLCLGTAAVVELATTRLRRRRFSRENQGDVGDEQHPDPEDAE